MNSTRYVHIIKHIVYALILLLLYVLQTVPGLFVLFGVKPVLVIPFAIAIAMLEGEFVGGIYGAVAGLLCDLGGFSLFGFKALIVCLCCIFIGLLVIYLMHCNLWGCLLYVFVTLFITGSLEHFFSFGMRGFEDAWRLYAYGVLPSILYSMVITPIIYFAARGLHNRFQAALDS